MLQRTNGGPRSFSAGRRLGVIAFLAAFGATGLGLLVGNRWVLPVGGALFIYPFYLELLLGGKRRQALALALLWAFFLAQATIMGSYLYPERAEKVILKGAEYKAEMFEWVKTGEGKESSPARFIPEHVRDFALFCILALVTGGLGALFLGALLLNYMNFYVAALMLESAHPVRTLLFAWQPYAIMRVVGYIIVATALTEWFLKLAKRGVERRPIGAFALTGIALVVVDVIVKAIAAPAWAKLLRWAGGF